MSRRAQVVAGVAFAIAAAVPAPAAQAGEGDGWHYAGGTPCRDATPECVREAAASYLVAVRNHDGDYARLAPIVTRTRNAGEQTEDERVYTRDELANDLDDSEDPVLSVHAETWVVDGDDAIVFYAIDASYAERGAQAAQTWLAERFHVTDGEIDEIEAIFFFAPGVGSTDRGWASESRNGGQPATARDPSWCTDASRACVLAAATSYVDAQLGGEPTAARLSDDVRRTTNGRDTGVERSLVEVAGLPPSATAHATRNLRWFVDVRTGDAVVFVAIDNTVTPMAPDAGHVATIHLAQRLRVTSGLVHEIEQIAWPTPGTTPTPTGWE